jgi:hypothetical protein
MSNTALTGYFGSVRVRNRKEITEFYEACFKSSGQWVFRGQKDCAWGLKSGLERAVEEFGIDAELTPDLERGLLRRFKRQCFHYVSDPPQEKDYLEWLALMQHHGAPTRLLDWTYSFFVALYFAIEAAQNDQCAVWALNTSWMPNPFRAILERNTDALQAWELDPGILRGETFQTLFMRKPPIALVGAVTPQRLNARLVIQQGVFLCPGDISRTFEDNLTALLSESESDAKTNFIKVTVRFDPGAKREILLHLQNMNMNSATLFPGLDGFARSLKTQMAAPERLLHPGNEDV